MHVSACFTWPDESSIDVHLDDDMSEYNPTRTSEMAGYCRDLIRNAVTDVEHRNSEHKAE